jgi:hypothetical protein
MTREQYHFFICVLYRVNDTLSLDVFLKLFDDDSLALHLWQKYTGLENRNLVGFYLSLDADNKRIMMDYILRLKEDLYGRDSSAHC